MFLLIIQIYEQGGCDKSHTPLSQNRINSVPEVVPLINKPNTAVTTSSFNLTKEIRSIQRFFNI